MSSVDEAAAGVRPPAATASPQPGPRRSPRLAPRSFGWHMQVLLVGALAPAIVLIGVLLLRSAAGERARIEAEALTMARLLSTAADREIDGVATTMQALATAPSLDRGDLADFYAQARKVLDQQQVNISLRDGEGRRLLTTRLPFGAPGPTPPRQVVEADAVALATHRPRVSDVFVGPLTGQPNIQIAAPVLGEGAGRLVVGASLSPDYFREALATFDRGGGWTAAIVDRSGTIVARTPDHALFAGRPASEDFRVAATGREGVFQGVNVAGVPSLVAYAVSPSTGWKAAVTLPTAAVDAALRRSVVLLAASAVGLGALGVALALAMRRRMSDAVSAVGRLARDIREGGRGELPPLPSRTSAPSARRCGTPPRTCAARRTACAPCSTTSSPMSASSISTAASSRPTARRSGSSASSAPTSSAS